MMMRTNWRGCKEWANEGVPITTTSDEASKMFDAVLSQYVGWYEDSSLGGIENSINKMVDADQDFVLGHVIKNGIKLSGLSTNMELNSEFRETINYMLDIAKKQAISDRENKHVSAVALWAEGKLTQACEIWEDILIETPTDMLALKFAHDCYFCLSYHQQMRDSIARVLPFWKTSLPLYGYILGMHAFGLEETHLYDEAEKQAKKALEINKHDGWATHALSHVYEMTGQHVKGINFMSSTENDWKVCGLTACHNYWHYGLYHIEQGNFEDAFRLFEKEIGKRSLQSKSTMEIVNSVSFLYRLKFEGVPVKEKMYDFYEVCKNHLDDHVMGFNDAHYMMACLGVDDTKSARNFEDSIKEFIRCGNGDTRDAMNTVGLDLCEAFAAYEDQQFSAAVNIIYPKRYQIVKLGGSNAQRDVFNLFIIHAALKSDDKKHQNLARMLISERECLKANSPLTTRLKAKLYNTSY